MSACPFAAPGRQEACLSLQKSRTEMMTREYDRNECYSCPMRRKRLEGAAEPERIAIPPAQFNKPETITPKKEEPVDQEKVKENVLRVLVRKGPMTVSNLKLFAAAKESKENFRAAVDALAGEGKVVTKEGSRAGSLYVAIPGSGLPPDDATVPSKKPRSVNRKPARTTREPVVRNRKTAQKRPAPAKKPTGNGVYAAAIAELEAHRTASLERAEMIYRAIETLRALA